jgi:hypothetical protein
VNNQGSIRLSVATGFPPVAQPVEVALMVGDAGYAAFVASDFPPDTSPCPLSFRSLEVTPPGDNAPTTLSAFIDPLGQDLPNCRGLRVTGVVPADLVPEIAAWD